MSEGTFIVDVLGPILHKLFLKNKKDWYLKYGKACLKASENSQKVDNEHRSPGKKIDTILALKDSNEEFLVTEVTGPPSKNDWSHFIGDQVKISKSLIDKLARYTPSSNIRNVSLYGTQG
ncbi:455_t:CDS:2 [Dentiscutata erythropus]|uniref:455_t:CDS:1 n=1 Tax=Dentiscutata erythropus TaxID=1348616 RepID=A0A9N8VQ39_9GLOM|nr:455_t:CDS:2 [Dentiscutata erythropus]